MVDESEDRHCNCILASLKSLFRYEDSSNWSELVTFVVQNDPFLENYVGSCEQIKDRYGNNPLHLSIIFNKRDVFDSVLSEDVNINTKNDMGLTPLHLSILNNSDYFVQCLLDKGANMDTADIWGCSPLHIAAARHNPMICGMLLEKGAPVNFTNNKGETALLHACNYGTEEIVYILLYYGADACIWNVDKKLPLEAAFQRFDNDCHEILFNSINGEICFPLRLVGAALKINSPLFPEIIKNVILVDNTNNTIMLFNSDELCKNIVFAKPEYCKMFFQQFLDSDHIDVILPKWFNFWWLWLFATDNTMDNIIYKFMDFVVLLMESYPDLHGFLEYSGITLLFIFYSGHKLSLEVLQQFILLLYSYGFEPKFEHFQQIYEFCGYCELFKFLLEFDLTINYDYLSTARTLMPYLIYDVNLRVEKFFDYVKGFSEKRYCEILQFFADTRKSTICNDDLPDKIVKFPSLVQLARDEARKFVLDKFTVRKSRDFYRLIRNLPITNNCKKILTYETKLYY